MPRRFLARLFSVLLLLLSAPIAPGQMTAFSDNFNRANLTVGAPTTYTTTTVGGDGGASILNNLQLELTNDSSASGNANGRVFVTGLTSDFGGGYNRVLSANTGQVIEWTFNFRQSRLSPEGFDTGSRGVAVVLGSTSGDLMTANGYALAYGQPGTPDSIRLVRFAGGLDANANLTNVISSGLNDLSDVRNYASVRVRYDAGTSEWSLFLRNDGVSGWQDPSSGVTNQLGPTAADTTYTGDTLSHFGFLWSYTTGTTTDTAWFDNYSVTLTPVPEPTIALAVAAVGLGLVRLRRQKTSCRRPMP